MVLNFLSCPLVFYIYFTTRESSEGVTAQVKGSLAPRSNNLLKYHESAILINLNKFDESCYISC